MGYFFGNNPRFVNTKIHFNTFLEDQTPAKDRGHKQQRARRTASPKVSQTFTMTRSFFYLGTLKLSKEEKAHDIST